ncbi:MAG TPA: hypothetical protein VGB38_07995 [bacterium]
MKNRIVLTALLLSTAVLIAQQPQPRGWGGTPEERAKRQTEMMKTELNLDDAQTANVDSINLQYQNEMAALREKFLDDRQGMREAMQSLRDEQSTALKAVLTPEQTKLWDEKAPILLRRRPGGMPNPPDQPPPPPTGNP